MTIHLKRINRFGGGGASPTPPTPTPQGEYFVKVIDYDGTVIDEQWLDDGAEYTLPSAPSHEGLVFQEWSSSETITDGKITIDKNNVMVGAVYGTASGYDEIDIELTQATGKSFGIYGLPSGTTRDWGDGTSDTNNSHTYTDYGKYTVKFNAVSISDRSTNGAFGQNYGTLEEYSVTAIRLNNLTSIGNKSFQYCHSLKYITFAKGTTKIGSECCKFSDGLKSFIFPNGTTSIDYSILASAYCLKNIVIPKGFTSIPNYAFQSCYDVENIVLPKNLQTIGNYSFSSNYCAKGLLKIPSTVTSIGSNAFQYCYDIEKLDMSNTNITFDSSGNNFNSCYALKEVKLGDVTNLPSNIFSNCYSLKEINISGTVTTIGVSAFSSSYNIEKITIPKTITTISSNAFLNMHQVLEYDFSEFESIPTLSSTNAFSGINKLCKIKVPTALYDEWIATNNWSTYANYIVAV